MRHGRIIVLLATLAFGAAGSLHAQRAVGLKAGINQSRFSGAQDTEPMRGLSAGAYFGIGVSDRLAIQIEAVYGVRGGDGLALRADTLDTAGTASVIEMTYLEVPLLLRAGFPTERLLPSFFVGPFIMFLLSCELRPEGGEAGECDDASRAAWFTPRATDYGLIAGTSLDLAIGEASIFVDARYALGVMSIQAGDDGFDARNSGLTISGGFAFPLGR